MRRWVLVALATLAVAAVGAVALGFLTSSPDDPVAWATLDTDDVHALAFAADDPDHLLFGHHDGLLESRDGGRTWVPTRLHGTDAMHVAAASGGRIQIAGHDVYMESTDAGATWQPVPNNLPGLDLHAFAVDPGDPNRAWAFAVGFGLFATADAGRTWELVQPGNWGALTAYRDGSTTVLIGVSADGLAASGDGGASWTPISYPGAPLAGGLAASADGSVLYAATTQGLRRSNDQGATWTDTGFGRAALAVAVAPAEPMAVAVVDDATRFYRSSDGGSTWPGPATDP